MFRTKEDRDRLAISAKTATSTIYHTAGMDDV